MTPEDKVYGLVKEHGVLVILKHLATAVRTRAGVAAAREDTVGARFLLNRAARIDDVVRNWEKP